jgi:hypothetical protein
MYSGKKKKQLQDKRGAKTKPKVYAELIVEPDYTGQDWNHTVCKDLHKFRIRNDLPVSHQYTQFHIKSPNVRRGN